jgi:hypothetical protein
VGRRHGECWSVVRQLAATVFAHGQLRGGSPDRVNVGDHFPQSAIGSCRPPIILGVHVNSMDDDRTRPGRACAHRRHGKRETREHRIMSKLREIIRDEWRRRQGPARGPLVVMTRIVAPVLSPAGSVVGSRQTGAFATNMGAKCDDIWQQRGEPFEAFEMRVKAAAEEARASHSVLN